MRDVARRAAWAHFGKERWRWFVFGPLIARTLCALVPIAVVVAAGAWLDRHADPSAGWLPAFPSGRTIGSTVVGIALIGAGVAIWRGRFGWAARLFR